MSMPLDTPEPAAMDPQSEVIARNPPDPEDPRAALVSAMSEEVMKDRAHWEKHAFKQMRKDMRFARGAGQWVEAAKSSSDDLMFVDTPETRYVANIVLRHIQQRTAGIYGKNPKVVARRKERLLSTVWDGSQQTLMQAAQTAIMAAQEGMMAPPDVEAIIADAQQTLETNKRLDKIGKTLELLYQYEIDEQTVPFKPQLKGVIRRTLTTGVGWVKLGFQRVMEMRPEVDRKIADLTNQLSAIERLSADLADGVADEQSAQREQLQLAVKALSEVGSVVVREGLAISYPDSTSIIPDRATKQLRGFVGAGRATEQYYLSADQIKEIYKVDVGSSATPYRVASDGSFSAETPDRSINDNGSVQPGSEDFFCVWETYNKDDGLVYVMCDGHRDFLTEPAAPDVWTERFWPWFAFVNNEVYDETSIFPPSDVFLLRDMQMEINRARQGLREHRRAARPLTAVRQGTLETKDKDAIQGAKAHSVIELQGLPEQMHVDEAIMQLGGAAINASLYDTNAAYEDILRTIGAQEANLGGTSGATATESSIAEGSRLSTVSSVIDDLDEFLTEIARTGGQILLSEVSPETVKRVIGPGAVWPELSRDEIAREIYLDVEAGSSGRPNQAQEVQTAREVFPLLMQLPGMNPEALARELLRRMGDRLDIKDFFTPGLPSIQQMNGQKQSGAGADAEKDPNAQGAEGANNATSTRPARAQVAPQSPVVPAAPGEN